MFYDTNCPTSVHNIRKSPPDFDSSGFESANEFVRSPHNFASVTFVCLIMLLTLPCRIDACTPFVCLSVLHR